MSQSRERPPLSSVDKPVPKAIGNAVGLVAQVATAVAIEGTKATFAVAKFVLWSSDSKSNQQPKPSILKNVVGGITSLVKETFQEVKKTIQADIQKDRQKEAAANMRTQPSKFTVTARGLQNNSQKAPMPIISSRSLAPQPSMPKDRPIIRQMTPSQMKDAVLNSARQSISAESQREKSQTISRPAQSVGERGR